MTASPAPLLEARDVHLFRGEKHLLKGVSLVLERGQFLQLVGPNGVGKTSLLRALCGLLPIESGAILWRSKPIDGAREEFGQDLAYLAHGNGLKADFTVLENLKYELALRGKDRLEAIEASLHTVGIAHCKALPARALSAGQKRRLGLARLILCACPLWILDEPTTNLDAAGVGLVERLMAEHLEQGGAIVAAVHQRLLASHRATRTLELHA